MDEVADAPWVGSRSVFFPFQSPAQRLAEARVKDVVEFSPIALRAFQPSGTVADSAHVGRLAHQIDITVRPVSDCIDSPAFESAMGYFGKDVFPIPFSPRIPTTSSRSGR